jgi:hypothetical protein
MTFEKKQYSIRNPKNMNEEIFFNSLQEKTSDGDTIEYLIRNYISANNDFYDQEKHSIFNPKEKSAWDKLDIDIKENVVDNFETEIINGHTFNFNDNEYFINNNPYTYYEFNEKRRKISNI